VDNVCCGAGHREAVGVGALTATSIGAYPWTEVTEGGRTYARSGNAGVASSTSEMTSTVKVTLLSRLSFDFKAWGEGSSTAWDKCEFLVDGVSQFAYGARQNDWETYTMEVTPGTHTLTWRYTKDSSVNPTGDYFAVDNLSIHTLEKRGDVDVDGSVTISDVTALIDYLLNTEGSAISLSNADCNLDASINISDVTVLIDYLLSGSWPEPVYTVVGTPNLFESEWDLNDERNNMIKGADGIYRLNKAGYFPEGTEIYFKIVCNHTYAYSWPAEERLIYIYETGAFSIDIIFDPNAPDDQKINIDMNKIF
jgi:hypothetical protein